MTTTSRFPRRNSRAGFTIPILSLVIAAVTVAGCNNDAETARVHLERSAEYEESGNYSAAIIELKTALQINPRDAEVRRQLGLVYIEIGDGPAAEKELTRALELGMAAERITLPLERARFLQGKYQQIVQSMIDEKIGGGAPPATSSTQESAEFNILRGRALARLGRLEAGEEILDQALQEHPGLGSALLGNAEIAMAQGREEDANKLLQQAVADGGFPEAWLLLGDLEVSSGRMDKAEAAYAQAVDSSPGPALTGRALTGRAYVRVRTGDHEGALADLDALAAKKISHVAIPFLRGLIAFQEKRHAPAQKHFTETLALDPNYMPAVLNMGLLQAAMGQNVQAETHLARYVAEFPGAAEPVKLLARIRAARKDYDGAARVLADLIKQQPDDLDAMELLGSITLARGRQAEGVEIFKRAAARQSNSAESQQRLARTLISVGMREEGLEALDRALQLDPSLQSAELMRIRTLLQKGEYKPALEAAESLHRRHPEEPAYLNLIGIIELSKRDEQAAAAAFRRALELSPGYPPAGLNIAMILLRNGDVAGARTLYDAILERFPEHLLTRLRLARLEIELGHLDLAREQLESVIQEHPRVLLPRVLQSRLLMQLGEPARALETAEAIRSDFPDDPDLLQEIGNAQLALGKNEQAVTTFQRLTQLRPDSAPARYLLARALGHTADRKRVRETLEAALARDPDHLLSNLSLLRLLVSEGDWDALSVRLEHVQANHADEPEVRAATGALHLARGKHSAAVESYRAALATRPTSLWTRELARAQWLGGDPDAALATLEAWVVEHPEDAGIHFLLADNYLAIGRLAQARSAYGRVVELAPDSVLALNNLAFLLREEDSAVARTYAERAFALAPKSPLVLDTLGSIVLAQGETERAVTLLREAAASGNASIRFRLATALAANGSRQEARRVLDTLLAEAQTFPERDAAQSLQADLAASN